MNHMAYLRLCKVFVILEALRRNRINLDGKRIFDYAFGAGTFFRYCPKSAHLSGVELDPLTVHEVSAALVATGYRKVDLQAISLESWREHPLLRQTFDVIICSHVLEHLECPSELLTVLGQCLSPEGILIAVVPINEIRANPHHVQVANRAAMENWAASAGLRLSDYFECDRIGWAMQPLLASNRGITHLLARATSLAVGLPFSLLGLTAWRWKDAALRVLGIPASQACAVLRRN